MAELEAKTVTRTQGNNQDLKDGTVKPRTFAFDFEEIPVLVDAFRRMVRGDQFDVCEMAITTYICAKAHGKRMTAVPVFLVQAFHHGAILVNSKAGIRTPKDLEGRKVGVNRGYTVTTGVWARSILQEERRRSRQDHLGALRRRACGRVPRARQRRADRERQEHRRPAGLRGSSPPPLASRPSHPDVKPLIPDALEDRPGGAPRAAATTPSTTPWWSRTRCSPPIPGSPPMVFDAFAEGKRRYVERLRAGKIEKPTEADEMHRRVLDITGDPLPYGIASNRHVIDDLIRHALAQRIITRAFRRGGAVRARNARSGGVMRPAAPSLGTRDRDCQVTHAVPSASPRCSRRWPAMTSIEGVGSQAWRASSTTPRWCLNSLSMMSAVVITLRTPQASPMTAAACASVPALATMTIRSADATSSIKSLVRPARSLGRSLHRPGPGRPSARHRT